MRENLNAAEPMLEFRAGGVVFELSLRWLRMHCPCPSCLTESGQRLVSRVAKASAELTTVSMPAAAQSAVLIWRDGHRSTFDLRELERFGLRREHMVPFGMASRRPLAVARQRFDPGGEAHVSDWLELLDDNHVLILEGVPCAPGTVKDVARRIAPVLNTIYGESWFVTATDGGTNIAYTSLGLPLHQDLSAYEAPPGLQLLHCLRFDGDVVGGDSTFADLLAAVEVVRVAAPKAFRVLCTVWATFQKVNAHQNMSLRKPHVVVDDHGNIVGLSWAPPFEGPYAGPPNRERAYAAAYARLRRAIEEAPRLELRLRPGDLVMFHNRRTLHGRGSFTPTGAPYGGRLLEGCYLSLDDVANCLGQLRRQHRMNDRQDVQEDDCEVARQQLVSDPAAPFPSGQGARP